MATVQQNQTLNDLLIDVCRSLLQYAVDAWPWAGPDTETGRLAVLRLAKGQSAHAARLADLKAMVTPEENTGSRNSPALPSSA